MEERSKKTGCIKKRRQPSRNKKNHCYILRLYVAGSTSRSARAISELKSLCETYIRERYQLEVIDIYQRPILARDEQIIGTPTLVRKLPAPLRRFIGGTLEPQKILVGMDLRKLKTNGEKRFE